VCWMVIIVGVLVPVETVKVLTGETLQQSWRLGDFTLSTTMPDALAAPLAPATWVRLML
jgi:hypothetical protein